MYFAAVVVVVSIKETFISNNMVYCCIYINVYYNFLFFEKCTEL